MNVLSLFSGVGGFDLGLENAGMKTIYQCEWDKHANSILERHWPQVPKWGDISTLTAKEILRHGTPPDVVAWGSPCQDLSVAGKRAGLEGERSGLFHEGIRIINELRKETNNEYPKISIWENVAGALSSNRGADFGVILDEMAKAGALVIEWGLLDAQFWIPQRRKRVFVIAIFNSATASNCPNPLLPLSESLRGDNKKGEPKGQTTSSSSSTGSRDNDHTIWIDRAAWNQGINAKFPGEISDAPSVPPLVVGVPHAVLTQVEPYVKSRRAQSSTDHETWVPGEVNPTLNSFDMGDTRSTTAIVQEPIFFQAHMSGEARVKENVMHSLSAMMGTGGNNTPLVAEPMMAVRRLTPMECERLMGWPDDHTLYKADGTEQAVSHRYKQAGNGVASPVAEWIGKQLMKLDETPQ
jgi:DNA (cytosine-5)-methyltransferase 1